MTSEKNGISSKLFFAKPILTAIRLSASKDNEITSLNTKITDNKFNQQNYQNFSMVSNLSKQVTEKELEIKRLDDILYLMMQRIKSNPETVVAKELYGLSEKFYSCKLTLFSNINCSDTTIQC